MYALHEQDKTGQNRAERIERAPGYLVRHPFSKR
jgi:hypothetical protein